MIENFAATWHGLLGVVLESTSYDFGRAHHGVPPGILLLVPENHVAQVQ